MAPHVQPEEFLKDLATLFELTQDAGTVFLTQKRYCFDSDNDAQMSDANDAQYDVLLRATAQVGEKQHKTATRIPVASLEAVLAHYNTLLHQSMQAKMRKRDRKREKRKADIAAARKRALETPVVIPHTKRGSGRRKFQRKVKAELRRQANVAKHEQAQQSQQSQQSQQQDTPS
ncbi:hypothetical protein E3P99_02767 [Wallemia hederae]|uniref:Signal recognition particle subunit SRP14 n=1 Tax=Wallemia hederae TaxID=1540922 RepID=A0A4T0FI72_9BASI|nr:hypothetical protein E3P99_02767 [Wallemia hederae]